MEHTTGRARITEPIRDRSCARYALPLALVTGDDADRNKGARVRIEDFTWTRSRKARIPGMACRSFLAMASGRFARARQTS